MTNLIQYNVEFTIEEGKNDAFLKMMHSIIESVKQNESGMEAYQLYHNTGENKSYLIEWFKDADAVLAHLSHVGQLLPELLSLAPITRFEVFGNLTKEVEEALKPLGTMNYKYFVGFIR
jgi:quinol monooxygenase YgiN